MTIGVGIAGYGLAGRYLHAPLIDAAGMAIRAVVTSRVGDVAADWPDADVVADFDALVARSDIDLVVVATPNALHFPQARSALEAGSHVVVDKPFTVTSRQARELVALADRCDRKLSVYNNRRWDSDFLTLRSLVEAGRLGEVVSFQMRWDRWRPDVADRWRERDAPGAGMLFDFAPHMFDQAIAIIGRPEWVMADVQCQRDGAGADDAFEIVLGRGRARAVLGMSMIAADGDMRYRVHGTAGSFVKAGLDCQEAHLRAGIRPGDDGFGIEPEAQAGVFTGADGEHETVPSEPGRWLEFYRGMKAAIETGAPVPVDPRDAADVMLLIETCRQSAADGRRLPVPPRWRP